MALMISRKKSGLSGTVMLVGQAVGTWGQNTHDVDCTAIPNYQNLTVSDFKLLMSAGGTRTGAGTSGSTTIDYTPSATYNASTGTLTVTTGISGSNSLHIYSTVDVYYPASAFV